MHAFLLTVIKKDVLSAEKMLPSIGGQIRYQFKDRKSRVLVPDEFFQIVGCVNWSFIIKIHL